MEEETGGGLVRETRDLIEEYVKPVSMTLVDPVSGISAPVVLKPSGIEAVPASVFEEYRDKPRFRRGTATLTALDSFIFHVNRFKSDASAVFACDDRTKPSLTAVLDYHPEGATSVPAFGKHRSAFAFPLSDEWKAWHKHDKVQMGMREFAEFLEDRIVDVEHPSDIALNDETLASFVDKLGGTSKIATPTKLMDLSTGLSIHEQSTVKSATKLQSGEGHLVLESMHTDDSGVEVDIPSMFVLAIPVFHSGAFYRVLARLRYRVSGGVVFWYELWRTDRVFDHAFDEACAKVNSETALPVLYGSPE
jgi:hypothetical protein